MNLSDFRLMTCLVNNSVDFNPMSLYISGFTLNGYNIINTRVAHPIYIPPNILFKFPFLRFAFLPFVIGVSRSKFSLSMYLLSQK